MRERWIGLESVIDTVNGSGTWAEQMTTLQAFMQIMLAKLSLSPGDISDSIQEAFIVHERYSPDDIASIVATFDDHLASFKN